MQLLNMHVKNSFYDSDLETAVDDTSRTGWPNVTNSNQMKEVVEANNHLTARKTANILFISESSVSNHFADLVLLQDSMCRFSMN